MGFLFLLKCSTTRAASRLDDREISEKYPSVDD
jgi:hypothetical protein